MGGAGSRPAAASGDGQQQQQQAVFGLTPELQGKEGYIKFLSFET